MENNLDVESYCTKCGACCRHLNLVGLPEEFLDLDRGDGVCRFLESNLCSIYVQRPYICNHKSMYELEYKVKFSSFQEYVKFLTILCREIQLSEESE